MQFSILPFSILLSLAAAQTSVVPAGTSACAAQPVLEACLASTQAIAAGCATTDYQCLCQKTSDVLLCFQQCPNDARYSGIFSNQQTYCADASVYSSAPNPSTAISRAVSSDPATTTAAATSGGSGAQSTGDAGAVKTASNTASSAAASATGKNGASRDLMVGAGSMMVGLGGVFAALL